MKPSFLLWVALLAPLAPLPVQAAPVNASSSAPQAGEIAIEGRIESLDVVKNTLVLRATKFSLPSGASKVLTSDKPKAVQLGDATRFVEQSGLKNLSLGDLEVGLTVRVVGRDAAGKPLAARLIEWRAPAPSLAPDPLTPRDKVPLLPPPQTQKGITLRIVDAGWTSQARIWSNDGLSSKRALFFLSYRVPGAPDVRRVGPNGPSMAQLNTQFVQAYGPNGEPLQSSGSAPVEREPDVFGAQLLALRGVNPAWPSLFAEFETLDPGAPSDANGEFTSEFAFEKAPIPAQSGEKVPSNQTMQTPRGTKITLQNVRVKKSGDGKGTIHFELVVALPPDAPDMKVTMEVSGIKDENDNAWSLGGTSASWGNGKYELQVDSSPPEGSHFLIPTIRVKENAPSLQKREWYRRFRVEVPVAALQQFGVPPAPATLFKAQGREVALEVEREPNRTNRWNAVAWIRALAPSDDELQRWMVQVITARDKNRDPNIYIYDDGPYNSEFWRLNGQTAATEESSRPFTVAFTPARPDSTWNFNRSWRAAPKTTLDCAAFPCPRRAQASISLPANTPTATCASSACSGSKPRRPRRVVARRAPQRGKREPGRRRRSRAEHRRQNRTFRNSRRR